MMKSQTESQHTPPADTHTHIHTPLFSVHVLIHTNTHFSPTLLSDVFSDFMFTSTLFCSIFCRLRAVQIVYDSVCFLDFIIAPGVGTDVAIPL